jgi:hypothetical protein
MREQRLMDIGGEQLELSKENALNNTELLLPGKPLPI